MSQSGIGSIPEPGHQSWLHMPWALHCIGGPSGGAQGGVLAFDGEQKGAARAVPADGPTTVNVRPPVTAAATANPATRVRFMTGPFGVPPGGRRVPPSHTDEVPTDPNFARSGGLSSADADA